jgi:hypothetical protein
MKSRHPLARFSPWKLARYEKENYVAYYQRRWLKLLRASVGMVKESFSLPLPLAIYGAYLVARAEIAFAPPAPQNDIPLAETYVRRFYGFIQSIHHLDFDVQEAARLEVHWWGVHRKLFGQAENGELVEALACAAAALFQVDPARLRQAAYHRAQGMLLSDRWVKNGQEPDSPLLAAEEIELAKGYAALREILAGA